MIPVDNNIEARFWRKVTAGEPNACWEWQGARDARGYGQIRRGGQAVGAHRVSWEMHYGQVPDELWVLHHCDNPPCVNPSHLFVGDSRANTLDSIGKGRGRGQFAAGVEELRGEHHYNARLTENAVRDIRISVERGEKQIAIARRLGVSPQLVNHVARGKWWRHVQ